MAKAELKTTATEVRVADFLAAVPDPSRREEAAVIDALLRKVTGCEPKMWGPSIIGYGSYNYKYDSGREGTMCRAGFSPRKAELVIYAMGGPAESAEGEALLARLGKHKRGKGCLYFRKLADVDLAVLEQLFVISWQTMNARYPD
ncbi:DUF1801 domain-containing protein [Novosphingobium sp.]|uniref:DUF1801 domain-containing protein n=1 Tax=Novosphingobium sp. TaxID=1874826 RepID=UPI0025DD52E7|nr:DUF1801 domain-containing protein [Novosphingobium sp.]MCC6925399.1 DUF1801 domain-containing protein [Novosphingobium sp.]